MRKAIGMVELKTVSAGMRAADAMVKTASVELIQAQTVCPGKFLALICGELSAVRASVDAACALVAEQVIDRFVLGNPHEDIFPALYGTADVQTRRALGILETFSAASAIAAADAAAKTSLVTLVELRLARGMCGKSFLLLTGEIAAVEAAIARAQAEAAQGGMFLECATIASPDPQLWRSIL